MFKPNAQGVISHSDKEKFELSGYHVIKKLFALDDVKIWRQKIRDVFSLPYKESNREQLNYETHTMPDGVTRIENFWPLIFNKKLLAVVRGLIGDNILYTQHSDIHINLPGGRWHRDNAHRNFGVGPDWDESIEPYKVVRVALYLSDYKDSGSCLRVLDGTHRAESALCRREYTVWNLLRTKARHYNLNDKLHHMFFTNSMTTIKTEPGDCVIFDQRVLHAGGVLGGRLPKYAAYLSYGVDNMHSHNHRQFYLDRPTYQRDIPEKLYNQLLNVNLLTD